ncbi:NAD-dependent epimerase/dehydratase family protein [Alkaliphilus peptidifermentans]|uniref:Nucleoside-diphosphate-sugar epimerase n=1 Tax=Alkaliphilus peptidifermentans DSM 18978 TaxID=1120976 RepID=A0A1G5I942_9FIRM|nr:NAD-dependent epimerase/dehydratase family protein [Alkaliphilus peptidifermentans]SCY72645.1 Nucleoside-diphosphate-sugar epimerase [Alkaliphilus peptidifermentans DSM 18978]
MKVLLTGANGFIGSHILDRLIEMGHDVRCLIRRNSNLKNIEHIDCEYVYGDLLDCDALNKATQNVEAVIHTAAHAKDWGDYDLFYQSNVEGTLNLIKASKVNAVKKIILTSSISVYGEEHSTLAKNEKSPLNSHYKYFLDSIFPCKMNYYRDTKRIAKDKASEFAKKHNIDLLFIEPVWVFGEREFGTGFYDYLNTVRSGAKFLPGSNSNYFHVIYVKELAKAYERAIHYDFKGCEALIIGNSSPILMNDLYTMLCEGAGLKKPYNLPKYITYPVAFVMEVLWTMLRVKTPPILTRGRLNMFYDNIMFDVSKAKEVMGFEDKSDLKESIDKTIKWYQENGYL